MSRREPVRAAVVTLGCPKNQVDSEVMAAGLGRRGFTLSPVLSSARVIVINTCAFIQPARDEAWVSLGRAARLKRQGRCRVLIVAGCLAQGFPNEIRRRFPEVDAVLGTGDVEAVAQVAENLLGRRAPLSVVRTPGRPGYLPAGETPRLISTPRPYAYLKIAEGCGHGCAFCLIPSLRGPFRSRPLDMLVREARSLEALGVREVVMVAQDTTSYGRDLSGEPLLGVLTRRLLEETGIGWIRFLYGCPSTLSEDVIGLLADAAAKARAPGDVRLCRYLDLPMQHASDRVLKAMRRPDRGDKLLRLVERLRSAIPGVTLRSTFIVGFPGETESDFATLLEFLETAALDRAGFFTYSPEPGTAAAALPRQVPEAVKRERLARAAEIQREVSRKRSRSLVRRRMRVIIDKGGLRLDRDKTIISARTEGDAPEIDGKVSLLWPTKESAVRSSPDAPAPRPGDFVWVRIGAADDYDLLARPARPCR